MQKNFARAIRLQLKTGYISEAPEAYQFLKRYPPSYDHIQPLTDENEIKAQQVPYLHLYHKAVEKNPLYADETVFQAYWQQEPHALTLAKKQYQLMEDGLSEEVAYIKARHYVNSLESKSYEEAERLVAALRERGATVAVTSDQKIVDDIAYWHEMFQSVTYDRLTLGQKGEFDYFLQTKILKWKEVERERRMRDPLFVEVFNRLKYSLFPELWTHEKQEEALTMQTERKTFKSELFESFKINVNNLVTLNPFYYDDYEYYFGLCKNQPSLAAWADSDRNTFLKWILNTLCYQEIVKNHHYVRIQAYLEDVRHKFFPMLLFPDKAQQYNLPSAHEMKTLLYSKDIGYRTESSGKLFLKRFYRLPMLIFPTETSRVMSLYTRYCNRYCNRC